MGQPYRPPPEGAGNNHGRQKAGAVGKRVKSPDFSGNLDSGGINCRQLFFLVQQPF
jgi:hypothetical protein